MVIAPDADDAAKAVFARKKNLRLLLTGGLPDATAPGLTFKSVAGGFLAQSRDAGRVEEAALKVVTQRAPTRAEMADLIFAFRVCKHVKSNAIVYAKGLATVGIGAGQMNRVESSRIAAWKSEAAAKAAGLERPLAEGSRGGVGRVLPLRRWARDRGGGGRHGGDPARRVDPRRGGDRRGGQGRAGHGLHRDAALPALNGHAPCTLD